MGTGWFERFIKRNSNILAFKTKAALLRERPRGLTAANAASVIENVSISVDSRYFTWPAS